MQSISNKHLYKRSRTTTKENIYESTEWELLIILSNNLPLRLSKQDHIFIFIFIFICNAWKQRSQRKQKTETQSKTPSKTKNKSFTSAKTSLHYTNQNRTKWYTENIKNKNKKITYEIDVLLLDLFQAKALVLTHFSLFFFWLSHTKKEAPTLSPRFHIHILTCVWPSKSLRKNRRGSSMITCKLQSHTFFFF